MKLKIYLFLIVLFGLDPIAKAQIWQPLGPDDFNQPTYTTISDSDLAFNGSVPYIFHYNSWYYGDKGNKAVVMKYDASGVGWEKVESPVFSSKSPSFTKIAINEGVPYVFFADETHYGAATVMKLNKSGTSWEVVGKAGFSLGTYLISPSIAFNNGVPYVCYINGNSNGLTVMKLNANGTDWEVVGSNNISYNYGTSSAFLAFNEGVPYICFNGRIESTFELRPIIMKLNVVQTGKW